MDRVRVFSSCILTIGYYRVEQILIGYFSGISLRHTYLMVPDGVHWAPIVLMVADGRLWSNTIEFRKKIILHTDSLIDNGTHPDFTKARI